MRIGLLGPFEIRAEDGSVLEVRGVRLRALLAALALEPGRLVTRARLVDWTWGEQPPTDEANALQALVSRLRRVLPDGVIEAGAGGYRLAVTAEDVDVARFERLVTDARNADPGTRSELLGTALRLWRGSALEDIGLVESDAFDAAVLRLDELRLAALSDRVDADIRLGRGAELVSELTELVATHPLREGFVAALMRALAEAGRGSEALRAYQQLRERLAEQLGVDPSAELTGLHTALLRGEVGERTQTRRTNLRAALTGYVGNGDEIVGVVDLVRRHRLVSLTGTGGSGKTRLATEAGRAMLDQSPYGVWLLELAPIRTGAGAELAQAALSAVGLRDQGLVGGGSGADPMDRLIGAVRERAMLLILDNCEHMIEAAAGFADRLLGECPRLRILATSREPLGITGEALWQVEPLALPAASASPSEVCRSPAVRLLADRADAVRHRPASGGWVGTPTDSPAATPAEGAPAEGALGNGALADGALGDGSLGDEASLLAMARICRALDGIPLAIELAAARLRTMTVDQLARRLDDRFQLLTTGSRTALPRHKTLRAVIDWSWDLLADDERRVLRRLSVFAGSASLEAAESVCADRTLPGSRLLELLTALAEKSLLLIDGAVTPRYRMLDTIREYAADRLAEAGESDRVRRAHLAYFTELAETADGHLRRAEQLEWLALLELEHDNIGSAVRGAVAEGEAYQAMRLVGAAAWYWFLSGHKAEGTELALAAVSLPSDVPSDVPREKPGEMPDGSPDDEPDRVPDGAPGRAPGSAPDSVPDSAPGRGPDEVRAMAYSAVVQLVTSGPSGDLREVRFWAEEAYRLARHTERRHPLLGFAELLKRMLADPTGFLNTLEPLLTDEDPWIRALARLNRGRFRHTLGHADPDVRTDIQNALSEFRSLGERYGISFALFSLGDVLAPAGEFARACALYEEAIEARTDLGAIEDVVGLRARQAQLYWLLGDEHACDQALAEAERCANGIVWPDALAELGVRAATLARWRGRPEAAYARLATARTAIGDATGLRAPIEDEYGYLASDLKRSRAHRTEALRAAQQAGYPPQIAHVLVGVADLALRQGEIEQAIRLLVASERVRGYPDHSQPEAARIRQDALRELDEATLAAATRTGLERDWQELAEATLGPLAIEEPSV